MQRQMYGKGVVDWPGLLIVNGESSIVNAHRLTGSFSFNLIVLNLKVQDAGFLWNTGWPSS
jgi:hypothetical protein